MDAFILSIVAAILVILLSVLLFVLKKSSREDKESNEQPGGNILPGARRRQPAFSRNARRGVNREERPDEEDADVGVAEFQLPDGKVGAKKLAKLQAKAERKAQREVEEKERQEKKKQQDIEEELRKKQEEKDKAEEKKREEEERKIREEKERKEHEEYLKLKEGFSVEAEGFEEGDVEGGNALQDFVNYIKENKVVVIEDIAAHFKLKTQQAIDRITTMQADGVLTGVIDDRGKFIYISRTELDAVAKFVKQRGRVSIAELVESSNSLIDLTPKISA